MERRPQRDWPLPAAILALAALLRLPGFFSFFGGIGQKVLWYDEAYSTFFASQPLLEVIRLSGYDTTPGLFAVALHFWTMIVGSSSAALAGLPFLISLASIVVVYVLGKELAGRRAGLIAAFLLALSPLHIRYATEVRAYSLEFLLAALSALFMFRIISRPERRYVAYWAIFVVLGLYSHYTFFTVAFIESVMLAVCLRKQTKRLQGVVVAGAAAAFAYLPQLVLFRRWEDLKMSDAASSYFQRGFGHSDFSTVISYFATLALGERRFYALGFGAAAISILVGLAVMLLVLGGSQRKRHAALPAIGASLFAGIAILMALRFIYSPRYYLIFVLPFVLFVGLWLAELRGRRLAQALSALVLITAVPATFGAIPTPATSFTYYGKSFSDRVASEARPGDLVLLDHFSDILFRRYYAGSAEAALFFPKRGANVSDLAERFGSCDYDYISTADEATLESLTAGHDRVWTVDYFPQRTSIQDPAGFKKRWFEAHFRLAETVEYPASAPVGTQKVLLLRYDRL